jgi:hypothetical protein
MRRSFSSCLPRGSRLRALAAVPLIATTLASCSPKNPVVVACAGTLIITALQTSLFVGQQVQLQASYQGNTNNCDASQTTWQADPARATLSQTVGATIIATALVAGAIDITARDAQGQTATSILTGRRNTGDMLVTMLGLASGGAANVLVTGPNNFQRTLTNTTTLTDLVAGLYTIQILSVIAANGHRFGYTGAPITQQVRGDELSQVNAPYSQLTGELVLSALGLYAGLTGPIGRILGPGVTTPVLFTALRVILDPGQYSFEGDDIDPNGMQFRPLTPSQSFLIAAGAVTTLAYSWAAQRALLSLSVTGLPPNALAAMFLRYGSASPLQLGAGQHYVAAGDATVTAPNYTDNDVPAKLRTIYRVTNTVVALQLIAGQNFPVAFQYWLWQSYTFYLAGALVINDPRQHALFVALWLSATLQFLVTFPEPPLAGSRAVDPTITISGPAPFVTVSGTIAADSSFVATGSGTVAGFSNVPARFTGKIAADGSVSGDYRLGQDTAPTGLPGGSITYRITGTRTNLPPVP